MSKSIRITGARESCCECPSHFTTSRGEIVCYNCGTCIGTKMVCTERAVHSPEDARDRVFHEICPLPFGSRTVFNTRCSDGIGLSGRTKLLYGKLSRINKCMATSNERNYQVAYPYVKQKCNELCIPGHVMKLAWKLYTISFKNRLVAGRSIRVAACAALYVACRVNAITRQIDEFTDADVARKKLAKAIFILSSHVIPGTGLAVHRVKFEELVIRFANFMNIPASKQVEAINLVNAAIANGMDVNGKDPRGIAISALYLVLKRTRISITQDEASETSGVTPVTIRNRMDELFEFARQDPVIIGFFQ